MVVVGFAVAAAVGDTVAGIAVGMTGLRVVGFDVVGGCGREGGSGCFCERIDTPRHNKIEHGYIQQNTYSRIGHIGACPA